MDAGCGTGVGTEYLVHLNPEAQVTGIDLSERALSIAQERCRRSGADRVKFRHLSLYDAAELAEQFDWINCVGVLHHLPDPHRGIQALADRLAPGGIFHIFVYAAVGRWEIAQMQRAITLLQGKRQGDFKDGVAVGRAIFASLPDSNRLKLREQQRWSLENQRDECFADMYVHPQEVDYTVDSLFELIDASGLEFVGFSNPEVWRLERLLGNNPDLMERGRELCDRNRYRLIERLDPEITHFEFFLAKPPLPREDWRQDETLLAAVPKRHQCMEGWPSRSVFDANYQIVSLSEAEYDFIANCEADKTVAELIRETSLTLEGVRELHRRQLITLGRPKP